MVFRILIDIQVTFLKYRFRIKENKIVDLLFFIFNRKNRLFQANFNGL